MRSKIASYLGFARRAGKLTLGINGTAASRKVFQGCKLAAVRDRALADAILRESPEAPQ